MRYKGHTLEAHYLPGATFRIKDGKVLPRTPKKEDIDFVRVIPDDGSSALNCKNTAEAKAWVDHCVKLDKETATYVANMERAYPHLKGE